MVNGGHSQDIAIVPVPQDVISRHEDVVGVTGRTARAANPDGFKKSTAPQVLENVLGLEAIWDEIVIGIETSYVIYLSVCRSGLQDAKLIHYRVVTSTNPDIGLDDP